MCQTFHDTEDKMIEKIPKNDYATKCKIKLLYTFSTVQYSESRKNNVIYGSKNIEHAIQMRKTFCQSKI